MHRHAHDGSDNSAAASSHQQHQQQQGQASWAVGGRGGPAGGRGRGRAGRTSDRPCRFFAQGRCRDGARCAYSHALAMDTAPSRPAGGAAAAAPFRVEEDPFRVFKALSHRELDRPDQFRDFLGAAIASLSGATAADRADTVLQMLCGVWRPPPARNVYDDGGGGGLYGASSSSSLSSPAAPTSAAEGNAADASRAHLHLHLILTDFQDRHRRGKLTAEVLCGRVLPLLRLLTHEAIRESLRSHWVNPLYDSVLHNLDYEALAIVYERLMSGELSVPLSGVAAAALPGVAAALTGAAAGAAAAAVSPITAAAGNATRRREDKWAWQPGCWLDVIEPPLLLLAELLERFQQPHQREALAEPTKRLMGALKALYDLHVGAGGGGAQLVTHGSSSSSSRVRRTQMTLRAVREQLAHGQARVRILDEQDAAQRRLADAAREASSRGDRAAVDRLRDPNYLPGELRPSGRRHDNDREDYRAIQVVPTCGELLCTEWPYLPSNRPGSMPHLAQEPHRARLEVNFRLLRHDVVAPLATALQKFRKLGGLRWLQQTQARQQQRAAATGRLELEGGSQLFVFRRVRVAGVAVTRQEGAYVKVTFEQPAMGGSSQRSPEDWWRNSKRLSHGTLLCFWWEPPLPPARAASAGGAAAAPGSGAAGGGGAAAEPIPEPRLVVGVVARRDPRELAGRGSPDGRPMVGIRLVQTRDYEALLGAWLDWEGGPVGAAVAAGGGVHGASMGGGGDSGGSEVVLVQEHNSFFAYEPVLRALQGITTISLAQYIVPGGGGADASAAAITATVGDPPQPAAALLLPPAAAGGGAELPAYWLDSPRVDLRHITDRERVLALPREEQVRVLRTLAAVDLSRPAGQFPLEELLAASSLDRSQAEALRSALAQEVAVIQGPPGTGKTFLGVALARVLLRNTRSGGDGDDHVVDVGGYEVDRRTGAMRPLRRRATASSGLPAWIVRDVGEEAAATPEEVAAVEAEAITTGQPPPPPPPPALERLLPRIGPLLVVCFTNHALDSFLEGLLDSGVTTEIVRVGGSSRSAKLEQYNLRNLQGNAGGYQVKELMGRAKRLEERAEVLSKRLQWAADSQRRPLTWDELEYLLARRHPNLIASFRRGRRPWNHKSDGDLRVGCGGGCGGGFISDGDADATAAGDGGGWEIATGRRRGQNRTRKRYSDLVSEDWLVGYPELDWRRRRVVLESERQAAVAPAAQPGARAAEGIIQDSDDDEGGGNDGDVGDDIMADQRPADDADATSGVGSPMSPLQAASPAAVAAPRGAAAAASSAPWIPATLFPAAGTAAARPDAADTAEAAEAAAVAMTPGQRAYAAAMERLQRLAAEQQQQEEEEAQAANDAEAADAAAAGPVAAANTLAPAADAQGPPGAQRAAAEAAPAADGRRRSTAGGGRERAMEIEGVAAPPPPPAVDAPAEVRAMGARCRPLEELLAADDVWSMSRPERQLLHSALRRLRFADLLEQARELQDEYDTVQRQLQAEFDETALDVLRSARVVGMTTSGVARNQGLVAAIKPRVLLVEEAAEVFEAHVLVCLSRSVEHLILIGDHEQLRPKPNEYDLQAASGRGLDLDVSLFERMVRDGGAAAAATAAGGATAMAAAAAADGGAAPRGSAAVVQVATLQQQRRMRPQISELIRVPIYSQLRDHPRVLSYPPTVRGLARPLFFLDHDHPEGGGGGASGEDRSKNNDWEARFAVALARHLLLQGYKPDDLVILVPYVGQLFRVNRALEAANVRVLLSDLDREQMERAGLTEEGAEAAGGGEGAGGATVSVLPAGSGGGRGGGTTGAGGGAGGSLWGASRHGGGGGVSGSGVGATGASPVGGAGSVPPAESRVVTMREGVRVATVDNFQGEEATVVLLSTVRNNSEGHIGFLSHRNRVNVMLSRARHGMVVLGSAATLRRAAATAAQRGRGGGGGGGAAMWAQVLDILERDGCVGPCLRVRCANHGTETEIREPGDFGRLVGDGGCQMPCGEALPCGHSCPRRCHADDRAHALVVCTRPCARLHRPCGHPCDKTCGEECGRCERVLAEDVQLPCGHSARGVACWKRYEEGAITCRTSVEVTLPGCGHTVTVPCCDAAAAADGGGAPCAVEVSLELPACGHVVRAACSERSRLLSDPTACPVQPCGALLGCGHECGGKCGECVRRVLNGSYEELVEGWLRSQPQTLRDAWTRHNAPAAALADGGGGGGGPAPNLRRFLRYLADDGPGAAYRSSFLNFLRTRLAATPGEAAPHARSHPRCGRLCGKVMVCGHECASRCHPGEPCSRCPRRCWISCPHHAVCRKPCGQPCVPCAEACEWSCPHRGRCRAPCGAPCERLPCDRRCEKLLGCGHRCPGLCGEPCPPAAFCVHPDCLAKAEERIRNQMVDQVMLRTLGELIPEDLDEDPLVVLPSCRHAFLTSTLDGLLGMDSCYARDPTSSAWLRPLPLGPDPGGKQPVKTCPQCREPIRGVRRYGRPVNKASLDLMDRKHLAESAGSLAAADVRLKDLRRRLEVPEAQRQLAAAMEAAEASVRRAAAGQPRFDPAVAAAALLAPADQLNNDAIRVVQSYNAVCDAYLSPPKARVYEAAVAQLSRLEEELQASAPAAYVSGGGTDAAGAGGDAGGGSSSAAKGLLGLETAREDLRALRPDNTQLCRAWCGILQACELYLLATAAGLKQAGRVAERLAAEAAAGAAQGRRPQQLHRYHLWEQPPPPPPLQRGAARLAQVLPFLRQQICQRLMTGLDAYTQLLMRSAPGWIEQATQSRSYNSAFQLAEAAVRCGLAQLGLLRAAEALPSGALRRTEGGGGVVMSAAQLRELRQPVLEQARATGLAALALYNGESGFAAEGYESAAIKSLEELMARLERNDSEIDMAELLSALTAVAVAEYGGRDAMSWLSGHLYRCPNGHPYVIADCGGAMERSRCPECGATIGGGSHMLHQGNAAASEVLQDLRGAAAAVTAAAPR